MREKSNPRRLIDFHHDRFTQIDESHCGPAVIQMLLHNLGIEVAQLVGIEWQGLFEETLEEETQDGDYGHYSVVTMADSESRKVAIVDPYKGFRSQDRIFTFEFFMSRWWDTNDFPDPLTGKGRLVEDRQMMFIITPEEETFPRLLGMQTE